MGKVKIILYGALTAITGEKTIDVEASTVKAAIAVLTAKYGEQFESKIYDEKGRARRFVNIYVNGKDIRFLENLDTQLNDEDKVSVIPAVGGGKGQLKPDRVVVRAPSTTANLGPGFDIFGLALDLFYDVVEVTKVSKGISLEITGKYATQINHDIESNTAGVTAEAFLKRLDIDGGVRIRLKKEIKPSVGLGSSAASAAATSVALNSLFGTSLSREEIAEIGAQGEVASAGAPHADNVSAAIFGGFTVVRRTEKGLKILRLEPPKSLRVAVLIPQTSTVEKKTKKAREVLPKVSPLELVVENAGNACGIVAGFLLSDINLIGESMVDKIVEPARAGIVPRYEEVREKALDSGAVGVAISGAGPSIIAFIDSARHDPQRVSSAMLSVLEDAGVSAEAYVAESSKGAEVLSTDSLDDREDVKDTI